MLIVFGMQEYGDSSQIMWAFFFWCAQSALPDQHVALAAVEPAVEVRGGEPAQLELVGHLVRQVAERAAQAVERPPVDGLGRRGRRPA